MGMIFGLKQDFDFKHLSFPLRSVGLHQPFANGWFVKVLKRHAAAYWRHLLASHQAPAAAALYFNNKQGHQTDQVNQCKCTTTFSPPPRKFMAKITIHK